MIRFEWDENKNQTNQRKHHISFEEAQTVFYDENALLHGKRPKLRAVIMERGESYARRI